MPLIDPFDRTIDYLRISVTDRCNFRCVYCMPDEGAEVAPKDDILTFEEIARIVSIAAGLGMRKVRLTGGEPLVRKDIVSLVKMVCDTPGIEDVSLTTNGLLLGRMAEDLAAAGLNRLNISLDTLRPERFQSIARRGDLAGVLSGIEAARASGMGPIKLNMVVMKGMNEDEVADFAEMTISQALHVRYIELMPINWSGGDEEMGEFYALAGRRSNTVLISDVFRKKSQPSQNFQYTQDRWEGRMLSGGEMRGLFVPMSRMRCDIEARFGELEPAQIVTNGPASTWRIPGAEGTIGFISQITNDHCAKCNRLRLTADGFLRPCLMAEGEVDLRTPLRDGSPDSVIADRFRSTVFHKPFEHRIEDGFAPKGRSMSQLGG